MAVFMGVANHELPLVRRSVDYSQGTSLAILHAKQDLWQGEGILHETLFRDEMVGTRDAANEERQWIWELRDALTGHIAEVRAMKVNESGAIRAGVFV